MQLPNTKYWSCIRKIFLPSLRGPRSWESSAFLLRFCLEIECNFTLTFMKFSPLDTSRRRVGLATNYNSTSYDKLKLSQSFGAKCGISLIKIFYLCWLVMGWGFGWELGLILGLGWEFVLEIKTQIEALNKNIISTKAYWFN